MEFTGERYVPSLRGKIYHEHVHRYAIAARFCAGKRVLDIASGEGYGSALLASRARLRLVGLGVSTLKQISASLLMGVAMFGFINLTNLPFDLIKDPPKLTLLLQTILAAAVGGAVYLAAAYLLQIGELQEIVGVVRARLRRGTGPQSPA